MSDRRPPHLDDDVTPPRGAARDTTDDIEWDDEWDEPNYLLRRAAIVAGVVVLIALVAIIASRFIGGGDGSSNSAADVRWNSIVLVSDDEIEVLDSDGDSVEQFDGEYLDDQIEVSGNSLVALADNGRINIVDLSDGSRRTGRGDADSNLRLSPINRSIGLVENPLGGDVAIIDIEAGEVINVADVADLDDPLIFNFSTVINPSGSHAAVPVPQLFQSFLIDIENETSIALGGRAIALDDNQVVTEQPAGDQSEIEFYDLDGERLGSVDVPAPAGSMIDSNGNVLLVDVNGIITRATPDGADEIGQVTGVDGEAVDVRSVFGITGSGRMIVASASAVHVLDMDGTQLAAVPGRISQPFNVASQCFVVQSSNNSGAAVVELETGEILTETDAGFAAVTSVDGCAVVVIGGSGPTLIARDEIVSIDGIGVAAISPDGGAYIVADRRDLNLIEVDNDDDPVEVGDSGSLAYFTQR